MGNPIVDALVESRTKSVAAVEADVGGLETLIRESGPEVAQVLRRQVQVKVQRLQRLKYELEVLRGIHSERAAALAGLVKPPGSKR